MSAGDAAVTVRDPAVNATPLLLYPVRIESRFAGTEDAAPELWVRVYPDQIMVNGHHPELTAAEQAAGNDYWNALWLAGNPPPSPDDAQAPWRGLAGRYGAPRAAWIVLQTTPVNIAQRPTAPTPPGGTPNPPPQPPSPPLSGSAWDAPSTAAMLPTAWIVALDGSGTVTTFTGPAITSDLAVSLSPADPSLASGFADGLPVDAGMRWLVDFEAAEAAGMGMRIPITSEQRAAGFDRVLVYGLSGGSDGSAAVAALLNDHHYSDGLTFVPQGSPTKNTADAPSFYSRDDPGEQISYAVELGPPLTADPAADGPVAATLLGVPAATFDHVRFADRHDMRDGQDMVTALWPATLGYFLRQLGDGGLTEPQIELARTWTVANVRPRGPLPAIAAGQIPYGILPVTATSMWIPDPDDPVEAAVLQMARRLLPVWIASASAAPHVGATPGDPDADLLHVLGMDASSMAFRGRNVLGDKLLWNLMSFLAVPSNGASEWWQLHLEAGRTQLDAAGYTTWDPRIIHTGLIQLDFPVSAPTVTDAPLSESDPLPADANLGGQQVNYITWLRSAAIGDIQADNYPGPAVPDSLLYKILRQSVLLDYVTLAQTAQVSAGELEIEQTREQELVGIDTAVVTPWQVLARPVSAGSAVTWADYLVTLQPEPGSSFERLADLRASMDRLAALPTAELDRLLTETLDICSHRLDAWVTALANSRLTAQRAAASGGGGGAKGGTGSNGNGGGGNGNGGTGGKGGNGGVLAGAYGFVQNLRPAAAAAPASPAAAKQVAGLDERRARLFPGAPKPAPPLQAPAGNGGFIHAPSMSQAAAGAVLRSGYLSHQGGDEDGLLAIDLSSDRVRSALYLLEGVQQGQQLGALLGYQLETSMHSAGLDEYIQPLRDAYPLVVGKLTPTSPDDAAAGASQVVDALALDRARQAGALGTTGAWGPGLPAPGNDRDELLALFAVLDDTVDAVSDVGVAEAVYQAMRGNPVRTGGTFDGLSQAQQMPNPQVVVTPRGGTDHIQRVCALYAGPAARAAAWAAIPATPRSLAEPWLDAWVSALLPDPSAIEATVTYTVAGAAPVTATVRLRDLGAGPLDVLAMSRTNTQGGRSELDDRVIYRAVPAGATDVTVGYPPAAPPEVGFADLINVARCVADLIAGARPLAASDLATPNVTVPDGIDVAELNGRASAAKTALADAVTALASAAAGSLTPDAARAAILAAAGYGLPGAIPPSRLGSGPDPLLAAQAATLHDALATRAANMEAITLKPHDPSRALAMLDAAFGQSLLVLPRFKPPDPALGTAFAQDPAAIGATDLAVARWRQQLTHVRPGISRLDLGMMLAELVSGATPPPLGIAQLPATAGDRWLALPLAPGAKPANGRVAIMALVTGNVTDAALAWSGLFIDGWPERIPGASESAGVAFNDDEPASRAPSAILLAACPDLRKGWDDETIAEVLRETLQLAQARTVDLASVGAVGQVLPALYFPFNLEGDAVSMPLFPIRAVSRRLPEA